MPSNLLSIDQGFPSFTGKESPQQQIQALHNYLYQLREGLQYSLQNLTAANFNASAWENIQEDQKGQVAADIQKIYGALNQLNTQLISLAARVAGVEDLGSRVDQTETDIQDLQTGLGTAEENIEGLALWQTQTQLTLESQEVRLGSLETDVDGPEGLKVAVTALQEEVTGEQGLAAQIGVLSLAVQKLTAVLAVAEDGAVTLGTEGGRLNLVGDVYINGEAM